MSAQDQERPGGYVIAAPTYTEGNCVPSCLSSGTCLLTPLHAIIIKVLLPLHNGTQNQRNSPCVSTVNKKNTVNRETGTRKRAGIVLVRARVV